MAMKTKKKIIFDAKSSIGPCKISVLRLTKRTLDVSKRNKNCRKNPLCIGIFSRFSRHAKTSSVQARVQKSWQNFKELQIIFNNVENLPLRTSILLKIILYSMKFCQFCGQWFERLMFWHVQKTLKKFHGGFSSKFLFWSNFLLETRHKSRKEKTHWAR